MEDQEIAYLIGRLATCGIWTGAGLFKLFHFAGFVEKLRGYGFPIPALCAALVITLELVGTLCLAFDIQVWAVAIAWILFTFWATWIEHRHIFDERGAIIFPDYVQVFKNVSIVGGLIFMILLDASRPEWLLR